MTLEEIAGVQVSVDCSGSGTPALIFVHGGACDRHDWDAQRQALSPRFRIVTADMPGHGESGPPAAADIETLAQAVCEIKARYGGDASVLVGHSMGCRFVLEAFRQSRSGVVGLVFVDGSYFADERAADAVQEKIRTMGAEQFLELTFGQMFLPTSDPVLRRRMISKTRGWNPEFILSMIRWDAREAPRVVASVNIPVLVLQSSYLDGDFNRRSLKAGMTTPWTELVTRRVPDAELRIVSGVGHFAQIEAAEVVSQYIGEFAERLRLEAVQ